MDNLELTLCGGVDIDVVYGVAYDCDVQLLEVREVTEGYAIQVCGDEDAVSMFEEEILMYECECY